MNDNGKQYSSLSEFMYRQVRGSDAKRPTSPRFLDLGFGACIAQSFFASLQGVYQSNVATINNFNANAASIGATHTLVRIFLLRLPGMKTRHSHFDLCLCRTSQSFDSLYSSQAVNGYADVSPAEWSAYYTNNLVDADGSIRRRVLKLATNETLQRELKEQHAMDEARLLKEGGRRLTSVDWVASGCGKFGVIGSLFSCSK